MQKNLFISVALSIWISNCSSPGELLMAPQNHLCDLADSSLVITIKPFIHFVELLRVNDFLSFQSLLKSLVFLYMVQACACNSGYVTSCLCVYQLLSGSDALSLLLTFWSGMDSIHTCTCCPASSPSKPLARNSMVSNSTQTSKSLPRCPERTKS